MSGIRRRVADRSISVFQGAGEAAALGTNWTFAAVSTQTTSPSVCTLVRNRTLPCVSRDVSIPSLVTIIRNRKFSAISSGSSTGIWINAGTSKTLVCLGYGTSAGTASIARSRMLYPVITYGVTGALDTFNSGASQSLAARPGWHANRIWSVDSSFTTDSVPTFATNSSNDADNAWGVPFLADQEVWITLNAAALFDLYVRLTQPTGVSDPTAGYALNYNPGTSAWKFFDHLFTGQIGSTGTQTVSPGDTVRFTVVGNTLTGWYKAVGSSTWIQIITASSSAYPLGGYVGFDTSAGTTLSIDTFGAGNLPAIADHVNSKSTGIVRFGSAKTLIAISTTGTSTGRASFTRTRKFNAYSSVSSSARTIIVRSRKLLPIIYYAYQNTAVLDSFNTGPNQLLSVRPGWAIPSHFTSENEYTTNATPNSAVKVTAGTWSSMVWGESTPWPNGDAWFTLKTTPTGGLFWLYAGSYYLTGAQDGTGFEVHRDIANVDTTIAGPVSISGGAMLAGDSIRIRFINGEVAVDYRRSGGAYVQILSATGTAPTTGYGPALELADTFDAGIDEVGGGSLITNSPTSKSTGIATFAAASAKTLTCLSSGTSSGRTGIVRNRKLTVISSDPSTGRVSFAATVANKQFGALSWGAGPYPGDSFPGDNEYPSVGRNSAASTKIVLAHKFGAYSWGSLYPSTFMPGTTDPSVGYNSTGIVVFTPAGVKQLTAISLTGTSTGRASFTRSRLLIAKSNSTSSGLVSLSRNRKTGCVSSGTSTGTTSIVRNRKLTALSIATDGAAVCTMSRAHAFACVASGTSSGTTSLVRNRRLVAISSSNSAGICTLGRIHTATCVSNSTSTGLASLVRNRSFSAISIATDGAAVCVLRRTRGFACVSTGTSTGLASLVRARKLIAVSNSSSAGTCNIFKLGTNAYVATGSSTGVARFSIAHTLIAVSTGSSSAQAACARTRTSLVISNSNSTAITGLVRVRQLIAVSPPLDGAAQASFSRVRSFACVSASNSSAIASLASTRTLAAISVGASSGLVSMTRVRQSICVSIGASTGRASIARVRAFAVTSNNVSTGLCTLGDVHALTCRSTGTSSALATIIRNRALTIISLSTGTAICVLTTIGFHAYVGNGTSTGRTGLVRNRTLIATSITLSGGTANCSIAKRCVSLSNSSSTGQTGIVRTRAFAARSASSSTGMWLTFGTKTVACISSSSSTGTASIIRARQTSAVSNGASIASCKIIRTRAFSSVSNATSSGQCNFVTNHGLRVIGQATSAAYVRVFRARQLHANSTGGSAAWTIISDVDIYGTVYIWDKNTYNMNITDELAGSALIEVPLGETIVWDK